MKPSQLPNRTVSYITVEPDEAGRRIDNFLLARLKGLPRSHLYKMIRKGRVRVNKSRIKVAYRLNAGDIIRVPPFSLHSVSPMSLKSSDVDWLNQHVLYEDEDMLILNKPSGIPVHGGYGKHFSLIHALRCLRGETAYLELAHRLDQATSGCLIVAKHYRSLVALHKLLADRRLDKCYMALLKDPWTNPCDKQIITAALERYQLRSGERQVVVDTASGKPAKTLFHKVEVFSHATLVKAIPHTGRTHQIRVHASAMGQPIAGDTKYGDPAFNAMMRDIGLKRLFLHAYSVEIKLPWQAKSLQVTAPLDSTLEACLMQLRQS